MISGDFIDRTRVVLIETLWNVKEAIPPFWPFLTGINRNIVECKD